MSSAGLDDETGEQRYAEEVTRCNEAPGDGVVGGARPGVVEMVVAEHDTSRTEPDGMLEYPVGTDADPVTAASSHDDLLTDRSSDQRPHESDLDTETVADQPGALLDGTEGS